MNNIATFFRESRTARFLIPAGIVLIVFSIFMFIISNQNKNYLEVEATISRVELSREATIDAEGNREEAMYKIFVKYNVNDFEYENELGEMYKQKVGDKIKIVYNPDNPNEISQPSNMILNICLLVGGIAALVGGIISAINAVKKHKKMKNQEEAWSNGQ